MKLSPLQLGQIEDLGELQFSLEECAIFLQVSLPELQEEFNKNSAIKQAHDRGRLKAVAAVRKAILIQAKQGSSPAQKQMIELMEKATHVQKPQKPVSHKKIFS